MVAVNLQSSQHCYKAEQLFIPASLNVSQLYRSTGSGFIVPGFDFWFCDELTGGPSAVSSVSLQLSFPV